MGGARLPHPLPPTEPQTLVYSSGATVVGLPGPSQPAPPADVSFTCLESAESVSQTVSQRWFPLSRLVSSDISVVFSGGGGQRLAGWFSIYRLVSVQADLLTQTW